MSSNETREGTIVTLKVDRGFGFIAATDGGPNIFLHCSDLDPSLEFNQTLLERRVRFETAQSGKGPRAINVRAV